MPDEWLAGVPAPLARIRAAALKEKSSHGRYQAAYAYLGAWIRTSAAGQVTVYHRLLRPLLIATDSRGRCAKLDETVFTLRRPSDGQWLALVREHARCVWPDGAASPLAAFNASFAANLPDKVFDELVGFLREVTDKPVRFRTPDQLLGEIIAFRNTTAHRRPLTDPEAARGGPLLFAAADWFCQNLPPLGDARLAIRWDVDGVPLEERHFRAMEAGQPWLPPTRQTALVQGEGERDLAGNLWLWWREGDAGGLAVPLAPVLERRLDGDREQFLFLNRIVLADAPSTRGGGVIVSRAEYSDPERSRCVTSPSSHAAWTDLFNACDGAAMSPASGGDDDGASARVQTAGALKPGEFVGPYELLEELGHGGMGVVYRARHKELNRDVALKIVTHALWGDEDAEARFRREIRALSFCEHPNIVRIFDSGRDGALHYFTMEYIAGSTLAEAHGDEKAEVADGSASEKYRRLSRLFAGAARGIQHLHDQGIVHRDVKPGNLMLAADGEDARLVVMDLGLARIAASNATLITGEKIRLGTLRYMAPEQVRDDPKAVGAPADVYGLGAVMYEAMCGRPPFEGHPAALAKKIMEERPTDPCVIDPAMPGDLAFIVMTALAKSPGDRYASAGAMAEDLERFVASLPLKRKESSTLHAVGLYYRRNPVTVWLAATAAVLAVLVGVFGWMALRGIRGVPSSVPDSASPLPTGSAPSPSPAVVSEAFASPAAPPPAPAARPMTITIEASALARGLPNETAMAAARQSARRRAVAEAGAEILRRFDETQNGRLVREAVFANAGGVLSDEEWLSYPDGAGGQIRDGRMHVRLRARVDQTKLADMAAAMAGMAESGGAPRVALWFDGESGLTAGEHDSFVDALERGLMERGIVLVDRETIRRAVVSERGTGAADSESPESLARRLPADFAIVGSIRGGNPETKKLHNADFVSRALAFRFVIDDKRHGSRAATLRENIDLPPKLAAQADEALRDALESAGANQGRALTEKVLKLWGRSEE